MSAKPKTLLYRDALISVEQRIVEALPDIVEGLISRAREGDTKAAIYLCDRVLGRVAALAVAPVEDERIPFSEDDLNLAELERRSDAERAKGACATSLRIGTQKRGNSGV